MQKQKIDLTKLRPVLDPEKNKDLLKAQPSFIGAHQGDDGGMYWLSRKQRRNLKRKTK